VDRLDCGRSTVLLSARRIGLLARVEALQVGADSASIGQPSPYCDRFEKVPRASIETNGSAHYKACALGELAPGR
jgi:hypothetical protein